MVDSLVIFYCVLLTATKENTSLLNKKRLLPHYKKSRHAPKTQNKVF